MSIFKIYVKSRYINALSIFQIFNIAKKISMRLKSDEYDDSLINNTLNFIQS